MGCPCWQPATAQPGQSGLRASSTHLMVGSSPQWRQPMSTCTLRGLARLLTQHSQGQEQRVHGLQGRHLGFPQHHSIALHGQAFCKASRVQEMGTKTPPLRRTRGKATLWKSVHTEMVRIYGHFWQSATLALMGMSNDLLLSMMLSRCF